MKIVLVILSIFVSTFCLAEKVELKVKARMRQSGMRVN